VGNRGKQREYQRNLAILPAAGAKLAV